MGFAKGKHAMGICAKSGRKMRLLDMIPDPYKPGLMVDPSWADQKHPAERPVRLRDNTALKRPAPNVDDDSPGDSGESLADALFPDLPVHGGGT